LIDIHAVIEDVIGLLEHSLDRRIRIARDFKALDKSVLGDPSQIQTAMMNLAVNARDAMPEGGSLIFRTRSVTVLEPTQTNLGHELRPGDYIEIAVSDTGVGIEAEVLSRIFEPFYTTKGAGRGTGLGLSMVYGAVKDHHGNIDVRSEPGRGSEFVLLLPIARLPDSRGRGGEAEAGPGHSGTILLVDDDEVIRDTSSEMLSEMGYRVFVAADGEEGVELYRTRYREIDFVILDMIMPKLNGRDAFIEMRRINPQIKAVISSGYSLGLDADALTREGIKGFIQKPFKAESLWKAVSDHLEE
jgi:CheY-like chemotaxis protein